MHRSRKCVATSLMSMTALVAAGLALVRCARPPSAGDAPRAGGEERPALSATGDAAASANASDEALVNAPSVDGGAHDAASNETQYAFDDGNDDEDDVEDLPSSPLPAHLNLTKVGTPAMALTRICDLTAFKGALYAAHANQPLGTDGATITRSPPDL